MTPGDERLSDAPEPFRLEPEAPRPPPALAPSPPAEPSPATLAGPETIETAPRTQLVPRKDGDAVEVSTATVRERHDPASRSHPGPLPPPSNWPREALSYPFRDRHAFTLVVLVFVAADVLSAAHPVLGGLPKLAFYPALLLWQVRATAASATGADRPPAPFDWESLQGRLLAPLVTFVIYLLPGAFVWITPYLASPSHPVHSPGRIAALVFLWGVPLLMAPVFVLSAALDDRRLLAPWRAPLWLARGFVACLLTGGSWAALVAGEYLVYLADRAGFLLALVVSPPVRVVDVALLLVGARHLGVLARRYET